MMIHHFVSGALRASVLLALALASMPLLRRAPAATRRLLLALALGGALVVPVASIVAPSWRVEAPVSMPSLHGRESVEPFVEGAGIAPRDAADAAGGHDAMRSAPATRLDPAEIVALTWMLGALLVTVRLALGLARSSEMARRAKPAPAWACALARAARASRVRADVRESDDVEAPAVTGVVRPVVLVPPASSTWSEERRYAVLLHELAHVRQRDCLAQVVAQLACAVHWFNPLAWLAARRLRIERELAADDAVITAGARASSYAESLLAIAGVGALAPEGTLGMAEPSRLAARVAAVLSVNRARAPLGRVRTGLLVAAAAAFAGLVACTTPTTSVAGSPSSLVAPSLPASPAAPQSAARTTIDPRLQAIADEELDRMLGESRGAAGTVLVLEPSTGAIRANAGRAHGAAFDVAVRSAYLTGSTLKAVTLSGALDDGVLNRTDRIDCEHGVWSYQGKVMHDNGSYGSLSLPEMLAVSTNIGFTKVFDRMGGDRLVHWLHAFHFGEAPPIEGAIAGWVPPRIEDKSFAGATAATGELATASPLQVALAYAAIANGGFYVAPTLTPRSGPAPREVIMKPETAHVVAAMLEEAVSNGLSTGKLARVDGARVAGKTGTAMWDLPGDAEGVYASFVGFVPSIAPRFVILVGVENPKGDGYGGGQVAAPAFARVASRTLVAK
jgi:beta-lactamase regulating signal transducer with metallopeptidase domain